MAASTFLSKKASIVLVRSSFIWKAPEAAADSGTGAMLASAGF